MNAHELMIKTNHYIIKGGSLTDKHKETITSQLLSARSTPEQARRFYTGVKYPNNIDREGRRMYPEFFIPPYNNGKKLKTILNQTPKTHILSANMYELEILRLLHLFAPDNPAVAEMLKKTLIRLKTTCFGNRDDGLGECFDASLIVLRFLATAAPHEVRWIQERIDSYNHRYQEKKRPWYVKWYYWLCLSELPLEIAQPEINKYKNDMIPQLSSEKNKTIQPVLFCILRNAIANSLDGKKAALLPNPR